MKNGEREKSGIERAGEELFNFAVDREDVKTLMAYLPAQAHIERGKVEYELQLLKIIWSIQCFRVVSRCLSVFCPPCVKGGTRAALPLLWGIPSRTSSV